ncbi:molecular chaperone TorD family protein [Herbaspirillum sp. ST 5-3]|uniref:TorD/DmsD family molecular chaperone n=1 Tax=Oxalobacteraceae TaxID=75682 RepID=UPI0010A54E7A|nr:molecular chaperone TorD family protein [Herbaspirillum sp. ST 5-3]
MQEQTAAVAESIDSAQSASDLRARASFYHLLAGAFVEEPGTDYLNALRTPGALAALTELGVLFDEDVTRVSLAELQEALAYEYVALFASPGGCPPVESARLAGRFQQEPYHAVKAIYQRAGFVLQQGRFAIFEDQLGIELSFVAALLERQAAALENGDLTAHARLEKEIKRFWALHLGRWMRGYASLLERASEHSFYREFARLLGAFADDELTLLQVRVDDIDGGREVVPKSEVSVLFNPDEPVCNGCEHGSGKAVA